MSQTELLDPRVNGKLALALPDPEVRPKAKRRQFSAEYKKHILEEAEACTQHGQLGALSAAKACILRTSPPGAANATGWSWVVWRQRSAAASPIHSRLRMHPCNARSSALRLASNAPKPSSRSKKNLRSYSGFRWNRAEWTH